MGWIWGACRRVVREEAAGACHRALPNGLLLGGVGACIGRRARGDSAGREVLATDLQQLRRSAGALAVVCRVAAALAEGSPRAAGAVHWRRSTMDCTAGRREPSS